MLAYLKWLSPVSIWLAVTFHDTINLGSLIVGFIGIFGAIGILAYGAKWKAAFQTEHAVATAQKDRIEQLHDEAKRTHEHEQGLVALLNEQRNSIAILEARPSYEQVVQLMGELAVKEDAAAVNRAERAVKELVSAFAMAMGEHEAKDEQRFTEILNGIKALQKGAAS